MRNTRIALLLSLLLTTLPARALDYALPDLDGTVQSLQQYRGKWVIVNYWASWCSTCLKEFPDLVALHENNRDSDIVVVGVNFENIESDRLKQFVARQGISYPVLRDEPAPVTAVGKVPALPTTYIVDPRGKVVAGQVGLVSRQDLETYIAGHRNVTR